MLQDRFDVERTCIRLGGCGRLTGANGLIKKPKNRLLLIFSTDFRLNSQIRLFYAEKWILLSKCLVLCLRACLQGGRGYPSTHTFLLSLQDVFTR